MKLNLILAITLTIFAHTGFASGEQPAEAKSERFGPGKAIEAFNKEEGFKLSEKATNSLGVKFQSLGGQSPWKVPTSSIVTFKQSTAVYRKFEGWISLVLIKVVKQENGFAIIQSEDLETSDEVAISGVPYLRMTDADLNSGTVDSCAH